MGQNDLSKRLFIFSVRTIKFLRTLPYETEYKIIRYQLIKSATSVGANYEEAQSASSKADFHNKVKISLKEMMESKYWLKIIDEIADNNHYKKELTWLINESIELNKILGTITNKTKK
jgi:four helix bundle protein